MKKKVSIILSFLLLWTVFFNPLNIRANSDDLGYDNLPIDMMSRSTPDQTGGEKEEWQYYDLEEDPLKEDHPEHWSLGEFKDGVQLKKGLGAFGAKRGKHYEDKGFKSNILLNQYKSDGKNIPTYFFLQDMTLKVLGYEADGSKIFAVAGKDMTFTIHYDDAAILYLNGEKIWEGNVPSEGYPAIFSYGSKKAGGSPNRKEVTIPWEDIKGIVKDHNKLAVELHQASETSSDIYFDFKDLKFKEPSQPTPPTPPTPTEDLWYYSDTNKDLGKSDKPHSWTVKEFGDGVENSDIKEGKGPFGARKGKVYNLEEDTPNTLLKQYYKKNYNIPTYFFYRDINWKEEDYKGNDLNISFLCDDAAIVYLNGHEIMRANVPTDGYDENMDYGAEKSYRDPKKYETQIKWDQYKDFVQPGNNTLAVELHNSSKKSSDIYFGRFQTTFIGDLKEGQWYYSDTNKDLGKRDDPQSWTRGEFADNVLPQDLKKGYESFGAKRGEVYQLGEDTPKTLLQQYIPGTEKNIPTFFFYRDFTFLEDDFKEKDMEISLKADDAVIVYINGQKVLEGNLPDQPYEQNMSYGSDHAKKKPLSQKVTIEQNQVKDLIKEGKNRIAVEVHNSSEGSSDIYFGNFQIKWHPIPNPSEQLIHCPIMTMGQNSRERNFTWYSSSREPGYFEMVKANKDNDFTGAQVIKDEETTQNNTGKYRNAQIHIEGLEANQEYMYRIWNGDGPKSEIQRFRTGSDGDYSFLLVGDPQLGSSNSLKDDAKGWQQTIDQMNVTNPNADFLLSLGDQVDVDNNEDQYNALINRDGLQQHTLVPVIGNHDTASKAFSEHFYLPHQSNQGKTPAGGNYYFVYNNTLFIVLNSNNKNREEHQETIEGAIQETKDQDIQWKVVAFHHSIYSVGSHSQSSSILERREELSPILKANKIDVVFMGHDHVYARSHLMDETTALVQWENDVPGNAPQRYINPEGILYLTLNSSSGSKFYDIKQGEFPYIAVKNQEYESNYSNVEVKDNSFKVTTYRTKDQSIVDEVELYREPSVTPLTIVSVTPPKRMDVEQGTALEDLNLPKTVELQLSDGSTHFVEVQWDISHYDKNQIGEVQCVGSYERPADITGAKPEVTLILEVKAKAMDKTSLQQEIVAGENIKTTDAYQNSAQVLKDALEDALQEGKEVYQDPDATEREIAKAEDSIEKAIADIMKNDNPSIPSPEDQEELLDLYTKAFNLLQDEKYKNASQDAQVLLEEAVAKGAEILKDPDSNREDVIQGIKHLRKAIWEIQRQDPPEEDSWIWWSSGSYGEIKNVETPIVEDQPLMDTMIAYVTGYEDGTFKPNQWITRSETVAMFARLLTKNNIPQGREDFSDVENDIWYKNAVAYTLAQGFIKGYEDGSFKPNQKITRGEFVQMVSGYLEDSSQEAPFNDISNHWAKEAINKGYGNQILQGYEDGSFKPDQNITRAEAVTIFNKIFQRLWNQESINSLKAKGQWVEFKDVPKTHWAYKEIENAANGW